MGGNLLIVDWWTWKCSRCDWKVIDALTVNPQQAVAEVLVRIHSRSHDEAQSPAAGEAPSPDSASLTNDAETQELLSGD